MVKRNEHGQYMESGNPGGRLKGVPEFRTVLQRKLRDEPYHLDEIADFLIAQAKIDLAATRELIDRLDGKAVQNRNVYHSDEPIKLRYPWEDPAEPEPEPEPISTNGDDPKGDQ
jgi:hypothetical protein